jgi:hypothetical protein
MAYRICLPRTGGALSSLLRAEPALECGSGAAAFALAYRAVGKAVAALPYSKARAFGPRAAEVPG